MSKLLELNKDYRHWEVAPGIWDWKLTREGKKKMKAFLASTDAWHKWLVTPHVDLDTLVDPLDFEAWPLPKE